MTIGDDPDDPLHKVVGGLLIGDTLIIAQMSSNSLRFYDRRTGELLLSAGGAGEGPGEYQMLSSLMLGGDRLYAYDLAAYRVTVLDLSGTPERTVNIRPWGVFGFPQLVGVFPDGSLLVSARFLDLANPARSPMIRRDLMALGRYDASGAFLDSLGTYPGSEYYVAPFGAGGEGMGGVPFSRKIWPGVLGDAYYLLDNKEAAIPVFDPAGNPIQEIEPGTALEPVTITGADRGLFSNLDGIDSDDLPRFYPFYSNGSVEGGAFWVLNYVNPERDYRMEWSVYSYEGDLLGRVTALERLTLLAVDGDLAVVLKRDELGVETVELRRIVGWG